MLTPALIDNPSPAIQDMIRTMQQRRLVEINAKATWSEADFMEALFCHNEYSAEVGEWIYSQESISKLAFDARTPDDVAKKLQTVAHQMSQKKP